MKAKIEMTIETNAGTLTINKGIGLKKKKIKAIY